MARYSLRWWLRLSEISFVEVDAKKLHDDIMIKVQTALGEVLYPGDERRIFLEQEVLIIVALYNAIDHSARQNLLRYARGKILDAIGEGKDTPRLQPQKATCIIRFTLSDAQNKDTVISHGTRVTPDGVHFFTTTKSEVIEKGATTIDILAEATEPGQSHNGFVSSQVKTLVDPLPFIASVKNLETTKGGVDLEKDDDGENLWSGYRGRIRLASSKSSTAGHELGYIYHAKSADAAIQDVVPTSPTPGKVLLTILMQGGVLPDDAMLKKVKDACSAKKVRPMTDLVETAAPTLNNYTIDLIYYIDDNEKASENLIKSKADQAIADYIKWQDGKIGRAINPDKLRQGLLNIGVSRIMLTSPVFKEVGKTAVARCQFQKVVYGGME